MNLVLQQRLLFLVHPEGGRDVLPANLSSGEYRPHLVIETNQPEAVAIENPEGTCLGVAFDNVPAQIVPGQSFFATLC